jgi:Ca2+-binding RTX toxin-like protein
MATVDGTSSDDILIGTPEDDDIFGRDGTDVLSGLAGSDVIDGGGGDDILNAGAGPDRTFGGPGEDVIIGGPGNDLLTGDGGGTGIDDENPTGNNDVLFGDEGVDQLNGGAGDDVLIGGPDNDVFWFGADAGNDTIADFAAGDQLSLMDFEITAFPDIDTDGDGVLGAGDEAVSVADGDMVIDFSGLGSETTLTLIGVTELARSDIICNMEACPF